MEFPQKATAIERALAAIILVLLGALCWTESRSAPALAARHQTPWLCWLALKSPDQNPRLSLALYQPARRTVSLLHIPEDIRLPGKRTPARVYADSLRQAADPAAAAHACARAVETWLLPLIPGPREGSFVPFLFDETATPASPEPALAAKAWLLEQTQGPKFWSNLARRLKDPPTTAGLSFFDRLRLALELHLLKEDAVRPVRLPPEEALEGLLGRLASARPAPEPRRPLSAEVFNASGNKGLASLATKILRLKGVDVVSYGNLAEPGPPAEKTLIYDRTGRIENALAVRGLLGCLSAQALTGVDAKRLVDVTVILAADCPAQEK